MIAIDELLAPISEDKPCGEDITYRQEFLELDELIAGKEETQFSAAVPPDWKVLQKRCLELFKLSKHLQVATALCLSSLETGGIAEFARALDLLSKLIERYWDSIYPLLDPEDHLDPLERMNILSALTTPLATFGDNFRILERLQATPLTASPMLGKLSFAEIKAAAGEGPSDGKKVDPAQVAAAFRDTPPETLKETLTSIQSAATAAKSIVTHLNGVPGSEKAPSFDPLIRQLKDLEKAVAPYAAPEESGAEAQDAGEEAGSTGTKPRASGASGGGSGAVRTRADVIAALDRICGYYSDSEPSSPLPLLLKRARRLVNADFLTIMADLAPDSVAQMKTTTGVIDEPAKPGTAR